MKKILFVILAGSILLAGCMPKPSDADLLKNLVVHTHYEPSANFKSYSTYYLPLDTMMFIVNRDTSYYRDNPGSLDFIDATTNAINNKFLAAGYQRVEWKSSPDLWVNIYIYESYNLYQTYNYYPYGYGYFGGYYPSVSTSDQANFYIDLYDLKTQSIIWSCDIGDIVSSPDRYNLTLRAIDQAFKQSPYVHK